MNSYYSKIIDILNKMGYKLKSSMNQIILDFTSSIYNNYPFNHEKANKISLSKLLFMVLNQYYTCKGKGFRITKYYLPHWSTRNEPIYYVKDSNSIEYKMLKHIIDEEKKKFYMEHRKFHFKRTKISIKIVKNSVIDAIINRKKTNPSQNNKKFTLVAKTQYAVNKILNHYINNSAFNNNNKYNLIVCMYVMMTRDRTNNKIIYEKSKNKNKKLESNCLSLYEFLTTKKADDVSAEIRIYTNFAKEFKLQISDCCNDHKETKHYMLHNSHCGNELNQLNEKQAAAYFVRYIHNFPIEYWTEYDTNIVKKLLKDSNNSLNNNISVIDVINLFKESKRTNTKYSVIDLPKYAGKSHNDLFIIDD